jgi:hypothetical protein
VIDLDRRRLIRYAAIAIAVLALGGGAYAYLSQVAEHSRGADGLPDHRGVRASDLWPRPVARLYYPGSTVVETDQADQSSDPNNPASTPARAETVLGTSAPAATVEGWYARELAGAGFAAAGSPTTDSASGEVDAEWRRGSREYFELKIYSGTYRVVYLVTR